LARDEGLSLLIVEHNVAFVSQLADRLVVLDFGGVLADGAPDDVLKQANVIEAYLGHTVTAAAAE
jgi:ABC-type branched-subunit amino acid transport system ATPase component